MKQSTQFYNGKINFGPLIRFLRGRVGDDWDLVHSEIIARIPTRLQDYRKAISWYVAEPVARRDGRLWHTTEQQYLWEGGPVPAIYHSNLKKGPVYFEFYVDPENNQLMHIPAYASRG